MSASEYTPETLRARKRAHYECDDRWFSCPMSEEGCANDRDNGCTCGAEAHNENTDAHAAAWEAEVARLGAVAAVANMRLDAQIAEVARLRGLLSRGLAYNHDGRASGLWAREVIAVLAAGEKP